METKRLDLRPFTGQDLDIIMKLYSDEEIMRYTPFPVFDLQQAKAHLEKIVAAWSDVPQINYEMAVISRESGEKIGRAEITRDYDEDSAMIGWILAREHWGKGYATEIAEALISYCFEQLKIHRVYALCNPENIGSWKVMEKCGMRREAHFIKKCKYDKADGIRWEDELVYGILKSEWNQENE